MIAVRLMGGLGNQMFQYAAGRSLSMRRGVCLQLDVSGFNGYSLHQGFELEQVFTCPVSLADPQAVRALLGYQSSSLARRIFARPALRYFRNRHFVVEPHFNYWEGLRKVPDTAYLQGYWQSEKYFAEAAETIRIDFTFRQPMTATNAAWADRIGACAAVSLHVRRGDYVSNARTNATHGVCSLDYYRDAVRHIAGSVNKPEFFIFSDDIAWASNNLNLQHPCHYIGHNRGSESYNDMRLMSLCKHHIIANSSFSWWGAWLNSSKDKIVIAPKSWFLSSLSTNDLFPPNWVTL